MLDFVPLARSGWKVVDLDAHPNLFGQAAEFEFPSAHAMPITAASIGGDGRLLGLWIARSAHAQPPTPDDLHSKCRCVMVSTHTYPSLIGTNVVHPIWIGAPKFLVNEVVDLHLIGLTCG